MQIVRASVANFDELLPLIADYQRFYQVADIDEARNRAFFSQFLESDALGVQHLLYVDGSASGFSTVYRSFSSSRAIPVATLNDLYVRPELRGLGYGRALIEHAATYAREAGLSRLQWLTALDNLQAQRLYDSLGASKSGWYFYALPT